MSMLRGSSVGRRVVRLALAVCGLAIGLLAAAAAAMAANELDVTYVGSTSLTIKADDGTVVRSGATLPAGSYLIVVYDESDANPDFRINGPGISISSGLNTAMGMGNAFPLGPFNFQAGSSYQITDANMPASAAITITFGTGSGITNPAGSSNSSSSAGSSGSGSGGSSGGGGSSSGSAGSSGSSGSSVAKTVGTLKAAVTASGAGTLTFSGKAPKTLRAGRYTITVDDRSKTSGVILGRISKQAITLSGSAAVGSSTHTVTLGAGRWFYATSARSRKTYFTVVG